MQTRANKGTARADPAILYTASVAPGANPYYGQLVVTNLHYENGSAITINQFLGVKFRSPAPLKPTDFWATTTPWADITPVITNTQIDTDMFIVTAELQISGGFTFHASDIFNWGVNGNLIDGDPNVWTSSFAFATDAIPDTSGLVNISVADAPDPALASCEQTVTFTQGQKIVTVMVPPGMTTQSKVDSGTYTITAPDLATADETTVATTQVSPSSISVETGETTDVSVTYDSVSTYSAIDVIVGDVAELSGEQLRFTVVRDGEPIAGFTSPVNKSTKLRRLPATGTAEVLVDPIVLNNIEYSFEAQTLELSNKLFELSYTNDNLKKTPVDPAGFVKVPIKVTTDVSLPAAVSVRLTSSTAIYTQTVKAQAGTTEFPVPVAPDTYKVTAPGFLYNGTVYFVDAPSSLDVPPQGNIILGLTITKGPSLLVRGFPDFLSFGGCTDLTPGNQADFVAARASSIFKYAGVDGAGDAGTNLPDDPATKQTIALARKIEAELADGNPVLPVMVSYTCNLSLGDITKQLSNVTGLANSFGNYILALTIANANIDAEHPVPAGFVVNPDFLGACQQENLSPEYAMSVRSPLQTALDFRNISATIPDTITDTLRGYVLAVNWLTRAVAPDVTFGWQVNLWGVGTSSWVYGTGDEPEANAKLTADYAKSMGVFDGDAQPDFMAVDRYEADDFTVRAYGNGYCYGPHEWPRFFDFCASLASALNAPIMPWQIPASRTPTVNDLVNADFDSQHWGTGGSYMLGDAGIGSDYHNVNPIILDFKFPVSFPYMGTTIEDVFKRGEPFDWTSAGYADFPLRGIFAVLLGGGSTTGIVSSIGNPDSFVRDKLHAYMEDPIKLDD
ncbi:carbohydrate binding domain-containingprotein [Purpureocillium lavendulum]|uniref:Carbohydrate binding domain-containingprotein n=1 Tax=Purpureocillium lavendulum TaxID=1247861 RepID=A0AB34FMV5_9HYPO|nr:carbohydrate binding domain-containingprotein [Purpureocillium lavendulum]